MAYLTNVKFGGCTDHMLRVHRPYVKSESGSVRVLTSGGEGEGRGPWRGRNFRSGHLGVGVSVGTEQTQFLTRSSH